MITDQILRVSSTLNRICYHRFIPLLTRFGSTLSNESSSKQNKSIKDNKGKSNSEYLADDMYNYTTFSYYDIETSITKYRLPQPSSKPEATSPKK